MDASQRSAATAVISLIGLLFLVLPLAVVVLFSFHETASLNEYGAAAGMYQALRWRVRGDTLG